MSLAFLLATTSAWLVCLAYFELQSILASEKSASRVTRKVHLFCVRWFSSDKAKKNLKKTQKRGKKETLLRRTSACSGESTISNPKFLPVGHFSDFLEPPSSTPSLNHFDSSTGCRSRSHEDHESPKIWPLLFITHDRSYSQPFCFMLGILVLRWFSIECFSSLFMSVNYYSHSSRYMQCQALIISSLHFLNFRISNFSFTFCLTFSASIRLPLSYDFSSLINEINNSNLSNLLGWWDPPPLAPNSISSTTGPGLRAIHDLLHSSEAITSLIHPVPMIRVPSQSLFTGMDMYVVYLTLSSLFAHHSLAPVSRVIAFPCFDLPPDVQCGR